MIAIDLARSANAGALTEALRLLPPQLDTTLARAMLLAIGLQESGLTARVQRVAGGGKGPARGLLQFERGGGVVGVLNHPASRDLALQVCTARKLPAVSSSVVWEWLETDDVLAFGSESAGLPADLLERHAARRVYVPIRPGVRSLNLANVISLGLYTALVRAGLPLPDNDGSYEAHPEAQADVWPHERARGGGS